MNNNSTFSDKLNKFLIAHLGISDNELKLDSDLSSDLNLDEVEKADLISALEKELNITIANKESIGKINTLADLVELVEENSNEF